MVRNFYVVSRTERPATLGTRSYMGENLGPRGDARPVRDMDRELNKVERMSQ